MLNPDWLAACPDDIIKIYQEAENKILQQMAEQIRKYDYFIPSAMHTKAILQATGATQQAVAKELAKLTGKTQKEVSALMTAAGNETITEDGKVYKAAKIYKENAISKTAINNIVKAGIKQTRKELENITRTTANAAGTQIYKALDSAWMQISTGAIDRVKAVETGVKELAASGLDAFTYDSGHVDSLEVAVRRAVVTGVNQTSLLVSDQLAKDLDCDLVEVSAHAGARPSHAAWQGKIFSRSGKSDKYPALRASQESGGTGYGTGAGLGGWNCRHSFGPWVEGQPRRWTQEQLDAMNEKNVSYNGKDLTQYEASQQQRYFERQIRKAKREEALGVEGAADRVKYWQDKQKDFIKQTGFKRQYDREKVFTGAVPKSTIKKAGKAAQTAAAAAPVKTATELSEQAKQIIKDAQDAKVSRLAVSAYDGTKTDIEIISEIAGGDLTSGSCASAALTYIGQLSGWDVKDFRDGQSRKFFSKCSTLDSIGDLPGVKRITVTDTTSVKAANALIQQMENGKMYYFYPGQHAAIVRKNDSGALQYLELQSGIINGWKDFQKTTLKDRFGCSSRQRKIYGYKLDATESMIEVDGLIGNYDLKNILEFINTPADKQRKGANGTIK